MFSVDAIFVPQNRMLIHQEQFEVRTDGKGTYESPTIFRQRLINAACAMVRSQSLFSIPVAA